MQKKFMDAECIQSQWSGEGTSGDPVARGNQETSQEDKRG